LPWRATSAVLLSQHGIDHLYHEALLGLGQALDALHLLQQLRSRPTLGGGGLLLPDEGLDGDGSIGSLASARRSGEGLATSTDSASARVL
jgi:hypothetical protein